MFDIIAQGEGPLFSDPDADKARAFFRQKKRALTNKVMPLKETVGRFVQDGFYLGIGGFGANRTPVAACHEIVRQKKKNLIFCGHTSTHDYQILAAGESFNRCDIAYIIGLEIRGLSPNARRCSESGKVQFCEWTNYALALRLKAEGHGCVLPAGAQCAGDRHIQAQRGQARQMSLHR
jgi:glutaconate CoA-transferase subunit A